MERVGKKPKLKDGGFSFITDHTRQNPSDFNFGRRLLGGRSEIGNWKIEEISCLSNFHFLFLLFSNFRVRRMKTPAKGQENGKLKIEEIFEAKIWWAQRDLNPRPRDYESPALTD